MTWWQAVFLGVLQGVTEFLPVSSSGHLALAQRLIPGFHQPGVLFDAMLHLGTALAIVVFERNAVRQWLRSAAGRRMLLLLVVGTAATAVPAFPLRHLAEGAFLKPAWVGIALVVTGFVVVSTRCLSGDGSDEAGMTWRQAAVIGLAQGFAIFPGISRSGTTIAAGLGAGLERTWAARFSFVLAVPAIAGATLVEVAGARGQLAAMGSGFWLPCVLGAGAAGLSGYLALGVVLRTVTSRVFHRFGWYCIPVGVIVLLLAVGGLL